MSNREIVQNYIRAGIVSGNDLAAATVLVKLAAGPQPFDPSLLAWLAMCLALKTVRDGHTCIDFARIADWGPEEGPEGDDEQKLEWPADAQVWLNALQEIPALVGRPEERKPFILDDTRGGNRLYLARSLAEEEAIATAIKERCESQRIHVLLGGPGTGKTTRVAHDLVERLRGLDENSPAPRLALAAPTGKAAARMVEVLRDRCAKANASDRVLQLIDSSPAMTVHKLLGNHPGKAQRFSYNSSNKLPYDLVIVDEVSMLSSSLMYHLLTALQPEAELRLVGDPDQLASVDAGTVLADIAYFKPDSDGRAQSPFGEGRILELTKNHRAESEKILELATAIRSNDTAAAWKVLHSNEASVVWVDPSDRGRLTLSRQEVAQHAEAVRKRAVEQPDGILEFRNQLQVLCAHRQGEMGVAGWNASVEKALRVNPAETWYLGRPVMVTKNNRSLGLSNGDVGIVIGNGEQRRVVFGSQQSLPVSKLEEVATVHALTIHKSQGSEYDHAIVVLPERASRILTRELLYTGVTRAKKKVTVIGSEAVIQAAIERPIRRATGLAQRLS